LPATEINRYRLPVGQMSAMVISGGGGQMPGHGRQRQRATQGSMTMLVIQDKFAVDETIGIISPITRTYAARSMQRYGVRTSVCPVYQPLQQRATGLLLLASRTGDID